MEVLMTARSPTFSSPALTKANHITCSNYFLGKWSHLLSRRNMHETAEEPLGGQRCELESQPYPILLCDLTQIAYSLWAIVVPSLQGNSSFLRVLSALI